VPLYRYLFHRYAQLLREEQKLDIEYPCREMLCWEDLLSSATREKFETTLGIANVPYAYYS
jgi:hypothetical protein